MILRILSIGDAKKVSLISDLELVMHTRDVLKGSRWVGGGPGHPGPLACSFRLCCAEPW